MAHMTGIFSSAGMGPNPASSFAASSSTGRPSNPFWSQHRKGFPAVTDGSWTSQLHESPKVWRNMLTIGTNGLAVRRYRPLDPRERYTSASRGCIRNRYTCALRWRTHQGPNSLTRSFSKYWKALESRGPDGYFWAFDPNVWRGLEAVERAAFIGRRRLCTTSRFSRASKTVRRAVQRSSRRHSREQSTFRESVC